MIYLYLLKDGMACMSIIQTNAILDEDVEIVKASKHVFVRFIISSSLFTFHVVGSFAA